MEIERVCSLDEYRVARKLIYLGCFWMMSTRPRSTPDVWAVANVSRDSEREIRNFFVDRIGMRKEALKSALHLTVYYARRALPGLSDREESIHIEIDPENLRFMPMAPGGENPRPDIDPAVYEIGVRIKRGAPERLRIEQLRANFYPFETEDVLQGRRPSDRNRNAFGARHYQPHITLLKKGLAIGMPLTELGKEFRATLSTIRLDRLVVRCRSRPLLTC